MVSCVQSQRRPKDGEMLDEENDMKYVQEEGEVEAIGKRKNAREDCSRAEGAGGGTWGRAESRIGLPFQLVVVMIVIEGSLVVQVRVQGRAGKARPL